MPEWAEDEGPMKFDKNLCISGGSEHCSSIENAVSPADFVDDDEITSRDIHASDAQKMMSHLCKVKDQIEQQDAKIKAKEEEIAKENEELGNLVETLTLSGKQIEEHAARLSTTQAQGRVRGSDMTAVGLPFLGLSWKIPTRSYIFLMLFLCAGILVFILVYTGVFSGSGGGAATSPAETGVSAPVATGADIL